jgi:uncharacterized alpha-E superfamily protein
VLARVAEALYWTARSVERAETFSRLLEVSHAMALEGDLGNGRGARGVWEPLVDITGDRERFLAGHLRADERSVAWFLTFSESNPNSILACIARARLNATMVRDLLPPDVWESLNSAALELRDWPPEALARNGVYEFCQTVRRASHLIQGVMDQGMRHDDAWQFLRLGRYLERAEKTARLLEVKFHFLVPADPALDAPADLHQWRALLSAASAEEAYAHLGAAWSSPETVARFLLLDERFPRSVAHCLREVETALGELAALGAIPADADAVALAGAARAALVEARIGEPALPRRLDGIQARCNEIDDALSRACFAYPAHRAGGAQHSQAVRQAQN